MLRTHKHRHNSGATHRHTHTAVTVVTRRGGEEGWKMQQGGQHRGQHRGQQRGQQRGHHRETQQQTVPWRNYARGCGTFRNSASAPCCSREPQKNVMGFALHLSSMLHKFWPWYICILLQNRQTALKMYLRWASLANWMNKVFRQCERRKIFKCYFSLWNQSLWNAVTRWKRISLQHSNLHVHLWRTILKVTTTKITGKFQMVETRGSYYIQFFLWEEMFPLSVHLRQSQLRWPWGANFPPNKTTISLQNASVSSVTTKIIEIKIKMHFTSQAKKKDLMV